MEQLAKKMLETLDASSPIYSKAEIMVMIDPMPSIRDLSKIADEKCSWDTIRGRMCKVPHNGEYINVLNVSAEPRGNMFETYLSEWNVDMGSFHCVRIFLKEPTLRAKAVYIIPAKELYDRKYIRSVTYVSKNVLVLADPYSEDVSWEKKYRVFLDDEDGRGILDTVLETERFYIS